MAIHISLITIVLLCTSHPVSPLSLDKNPALSSKNPPVTGLHNNAYVSSSKISFDEKPSQNFYQDSFFERLGAEIYQYWNSQSLAQFHR